MKIKYRNKKIEKGFSSAYQKSWVYPKKVKEQLLIAENLMRNADSFLDIANYLPFHLEKLIGDRKDEWSIRIPNTGYRVILYPCDENGKEMIGGDILESSRKIKVIKIMEVTKHYE